MSIPQLRIVTYLCPSIPVDLFQNIVEVIEDKIGFQTTLQYEWRSEGYSEDRIDLFQSNLIDLGDQILPRSATKCNKKDCVQISRMNLDDLESSYPIRRIMKFCVMEISSHITPFMPSTGYISLMENEKKNAFAELLPISPIFKHPKSDQQNAGSYIDVIVHSDKLKHSITEILDLRGCRWACVDNSVSKAVMLSELKKLGENITFFGSNHRASSHFAAVNMVLTKQVDVATIDSCALTCNKRFLHNGAKDVSVLTSFGPFAPYAIVINSRINGELKNKIIAALSSISNKDVKFDRFGLAKFVSNHPNAYITECEFMKGQKLGLSEVPYY